MWLGGWSGRWLGGWSGGWSGGWVGGRVGCRNLIIKTISAELDYAELAVKKISMVYRSFCFVGVKLISEN